MKGFRPSHDIHLVLEKNGRNVPDRWVLQRPGASPATGGGRQVRRPRRKGRNPETPANWALHRIPAQSLENIHPESGTAG